MRENHDIRKKAKDCGVYLWEVAQELGEAENEFFKRLRKPVTSIEKRRIFKAIEAVAERWKR